MARAEDNMLQTFVWTLYLMSNIVFLCDCDTNLTKLHLLGLFPMTGAWPGGKAMSLATQLALQDINANIDILPGYEIVIIPKNTEVR